MNKMGTFIGCIFILFCLLGLSLLMIGVFDNECLDGELGDWIKMRIKKNLPKIE